MIHSSRQTTEHPSRTPSLCEDVVLLAEVTRSTVEERQRHLRLPPSVVSKHEQLCSNLHSSDACSGNVDSSNLADRFLTVSGLNKPPP